MPIEISIPPLAMQRIAEAKTDMEAYAILYDLGAPKGKWGYLPYKPRIVANSGGVGPVKMIWDD